MNIQDVTDKIFQTVKSIIYPTDLQRMGYLIFCQTEGYHLSENHYDLFMSTLSNQKLLDKVINLDIEFIDTITEIKKEDIRDITALHYSDYESITLLFENCIIDEKLRWSICIYQDFWGIFYGPKLLLDELHEKYDFHSDLEQFKKEIREDIENEMIRESFERLIRLSYMREQA